MNTPQYVTCRCQHCDCGIEFDATQLAEENSIVPCPHCGLETKISIPKSLSLLALCGPQVRLPEIQTPLAIDPPSSPRTSMVVVKRRMHLQMAKLTALDMKKGPTKHGNPVHRAAKNGVIPAIPSHLLTLELFMEQNSCGESPCTLQHGIIIFIKFQQYF
jgi:hypothetical protein